MEYRIGDKVLVEVEVTDVPCVEPIYYVETEYGMNGWVYEREIHPMDAKTYEDGLNDAWETARKIATDADGEELDYETLYEIFGDGTTMGNIFKNYTAAEAAGKLAAWEESKRINVGDVVRIKDVDGRAVVTQVEDGGCQLLFGDGGTGCADAVDIVKTGRTIDITGVLAQIGGDVDE